MDAYDFASEFKALEEYRDQKFDIKLEDDRTCGMDVTEIKITTNGTSWMGVSLKRNEIQRLIDTLTEHIKEN